MRRWRTTPYGIEASRILCWEILSGQENKPDVVDSRKERVALGRQVPAQVEQKRGERCR